MSQVIVKIRLLIESAQDHLREQEFSKSTIDKYSLLWERLVDYMSKSGVRNYNRKVGQYYLEHLFGRFSYSKLSKQEKTIVRKIQYLTEFQEKGIVSRKRKGPEAKFVGNIGKLIENFILARRESGLSASSMLSYRRYLHVLLVFMERQKIDSPDSIKPAHVFTFVESLKSKSQTTQYCLLSAVRSFLKYLHEVDPNTGDLSSIIPKVNYIRQAKLPSIYSREEIQSLLAVIDRGNPKGKRDYAIILIGARLGLRASDILGLTFTNILWNECKIVLDQKKTSRPLELPLTSEIGEAIIDYLKHGRPVSELPYVFLRLTPPFGQMTNIGASTLTSNYLTLAGIDISQRKHGTHILRHSLVAELLNKKTPIQVISGTLGHSTIDSTRHYLRIDTQAMEPCALQIPVVIPEFYDKVTDFFFSQKNKEETK
jgi:integrase/recombinase XerD